jgi:O-antigen/teichoic acid export membrane protein
VQLLIALLALVLYLAFAARGTGNLIVVAELSVYVVAWTVSYTFFVPALASQQMMKPALIDLSCRLTAILSAILLAGFAPVTLPWVLAAFPAAGIALALLALRSAAAHGVSLKVTRNWSGILSTWRATSAFAGSELLNQFYARADILLIAYFLGNASVGLYATDVKFVEVGILPLVLFGTAAYPLLSSHAAHDKPAFGASARDFTRVVFFASGWLGVGLYYFIPLIIVPVFGAKFAPSAVFLPWFALFVVLKAWEVAFYRLLYSLRRQLFYCYSLILGTVVILALNLWLIPRYAIPGAIAAVIASIVVVNSFCAFGLKRELGAGFLAGLLARLAAALVLAAAAALCVGRLLNAGPWAAAAAACVLYPLLGALLGLVPHPRRSPLLHQPQGEGT